MLGNKPVNKPINGRNAQMLNTYSILVESASFPNNADPMPPIPKAKPKNSPATNPTFPGINSCAYTKIAENADAKIIPIGTINTPTQNRLACGNNNANGAVPKIDAQITYFLPILSPIGPPSNVPAATENKNTNR